MRRAFAVLAALVAIPGAGFAAEKPIKGLFLGDEGHHRPADRFRQLQPVLAKRGIELTYTNSVKLLAKETLAGYDVLVIYANTERIAPEQEQALLEFVEGGKGLVPLHCASYCFLNSPKYIALVGAQFRRHGTGVFRTTIARPDHEIMKGFVGFESWDETYVHTKHNEQDRTVLEVRAEGDTKEPWTWVRTQGKGRVFYTAWGHDHRTWGAAGFQDLVERGIRWAAKREPVSSSTSTAPADPTAAMDIPFPIPRMTALPKDLKTPEYVEVGKKIPNYTPGRQWGTQGTPLSLMQKPLPPDESMKRTSVPTGFHVELFLAEHQLPGGKPLCMNWDERGRLWVALSVDYPNDLQRPGEGHDRIVVCEDADGDGRADKVTEFADKLSIPTSIAFHRGGAIVQDGTQTLYLKDTNGDGRADERRVMFTGWGLGDTHGGVSNFQYGLDNWIWAMQGYNFSRPRPPGAAEEPRPSGRRQPGSRQTGARQDGFRQGFFRFRPDGSQVEFLRSTDNNTWGLGLSEEGLVFGSTANRCPSVYMPIPNRYYEAVRGWTPSLVLRMISDTYLFKPLAEHIRQVDQHGGYTAAAGHSLYTARAYPKEYWNRVAFVCEPTGHLVGSFVLNRQGADFRSTNSFNLLASIDEWSAPIMAEVGPDGQVWVADWYNFIVQHNPTPVGFRTGRGAAYESDLRDKKHGRVYRVVYDQAPKVAPVSLAGASAEQLVETLRHPTLLWRRHAQRLLVERGQADVAEKLFAWVRDQRMDEIGLNVGAMHALWTLHGLRLLDGKHDAATSVAVAALKHPSPGVRRNAVQVLPPAAASVQAVLDAGLVNDAHPQVRLAALLALADLPLAPAAGQAVAAALCDPSVADERWLSDAATSAAAKQAASFLPAIAAAKQPPSKALEVTGIVAEHFARGGPVESAPAVLASLAAAELPVAEAVVRGLSRGWPRDTPVKLDEQASQRIEKLAGRLSPGGRGLLIKLAAAWGSQQFERLAAQTRSELLKQLHDAARSDAQRLASASELVALGPRDAKLAESLLDAVTPQTKPVLATGFLHALEGSEASELGQLVVDRLSKYTPTVRAAGVSLLLSRPESTKALLEAFDDRRAALADLSLDQRQALATHLDIDIRRRANEILRRAGSLPNPDRQKVIDELLAVTKTKGNAKAGLEVFKKTCAKCHTHNGEGTHVGPDLTGMAVHPKEELLLQVLDPNRSVEGNYRVYKVLTTDGQSVDGLLASESQTAIELFDAEGKKRTLLREDIEQIAATPTSLMPEGFEKQITRKQMTDLLEFLTTRGKYLPLDLSKVATTTSVKGMFYDPEAAVERLVFDDWKPKTFRGVPFLLADPREGRANNVVLLYSPQGTNPPKMPRRVELPCKTAAKAIHLLGGISGWGYPYSERGSVSVTVRLHYGDGKSEDHDLKNGEHFADYIRRVDVPGSEYAFAARRQQVRYLAVQPKRPDVIDRIELVKGPDATAPVIVAVTVETVQ